MPGEAILSGYRDSGLGNQVAEPNWSLCHNEVEGNRRVPHVRQSVRGPKMMGKPIDRFPFIPWQIPLIRTALRSFDPDRQMQ